MLELRRADIGFGRVILDDRGVTRTRLFGRSAFLAWDQIVDYRLTITLHGAASAGPMYFIDGLDTLAAVIDFKRALRGDSALRFGVALRDQGGAALGFDWRFKEHGRAIALVLERIGPRLAELPRAELARAGSAAFGRLRVGPEAIQWLERDPLPRDEVEVIELFNSSPVKLRVMKHGKVLPYAQTETANLPCLHALLDVAAALGYPVRGRELFEALREHAEIPALLA